MESLEKIHYGWDGQSKWEGQIEEVSEEGLGTGPKGHHKAGDPPLRMQAYTLKSRDQNEEQEFEIFLRD